MRASAERHLTIGACRCARRITLDGAFLGIVVRFVCRIFDLRIFIALGAAERVGVFEVGAGFGGRRLDVVQNAHGDQLVARAETDAADAGGGAAGKDADLLHRKADALAQRRRQQHVVGRRADLDVDDGVALVLQLHGDLAGAVHRNEIGQHVAADSAGARGEQDVELFPLFLGRPAAA